MIKAGIIGSTGYAGSELARLLTGHPSVTVEYLTSQSYEEKPYGGVYENFRHTDFVCQSENIEEMAERCDVIFLALPHGIASGKVTDEILRKTKIIDLGADFRIKDAGIYEKWYNVGHESKHLLDEAVYGLCEINREQIKGSRLVANPGCYTTCAILPLYPLLKEGVVARKGIIIDSKSGVSGAGRGVNLGVHFCEVNETIKAYKLTSHRHTPEIEEQLSIASGQDISVTFTPHLVPMNRGILTTAYADISDGYSYSDIKAIYDKYYGGEFFIRLTKEGVFPETRWVKGSNFVDIGFIIDERTNKLIIVSALDNIVKGAAGQAVQNMNILFGLDEKTGLTPIPAFPI